MASNFCR
ncbi:hypothetical protein YPPY60_1949, partial [Yersinia pestis PY-60]